MNRKAYLLTTSAPRALIRATKDIPLRRIDPDEVVAGYTAR